MKTKARLALSWYEGKPQGTGTFVAAHCGVTVLVWREKVYSSDSEGWRNCSATLGEQAELANLKLSFIVFHDRIGSLGSLGYDGVSETIDRRVAKRMHETLTKIESSMKRMEQAEGAPLSFGQEVNRFARAIGAEGLLIWDGESGWYDKDSYSSYGLNSLASQVDWQIKKLQESMQALKSA